MNWDDLRLFLAVARAGSISGAARLLGVQHSTVSRRLRQLEASMGARLVDRQADGYRLTPAGDTRRLPRGYRMDTDMRPSTRKIVCKTPFDE